MYRTGDDGWAYWARNVTITNPAGGASDISWLLDAGAAGNNTGHAEVLYGQITNGDTVARDTSITLGDGITTILNILPVTSLNAAAVLRFPFVGAAPAAAGNNPDINYPYIVGGGLRLTFLVAAVALSQDATLGFILRWKGLKPTLTPVGGPLFALTNIVDLVW